MTSHAAERYVIKPVVSAFRILEVLRDARAPLSMTDISRRTNASKTTTFRYLKTLSLLGYVTQIGKSYTVGISAFSMGDADLWEASLVALSAVHLKDLSGCFRETANLGIPRGKRISYLTVVEPEGAPRFDTESGDADCFHCTALGKAILAFLPPGQAAAHLNASLPRFTPNTITTRRRLDTAFAEVRRLGYAIDREENRVGCVCYAAPILAGDATPIAAISVTLPTARLTDRLDLEVPETVKRHARIISSALEQRSSALPPDVMRPSRRGACAVEAAE